MKNQILKITTLSALTSSFLLAATPNIGDVEKQIQVPKEVQKQQQELIQIGGVKKYAPPMVDDKSGKTIFVKNFKIENAIHINEEKLLNLISSFNGKDLTFAQITEATNIITQEYRKEGYFVARAYLPVQDIKKNDGVITISVIEGNYGEFKLNNSSLVKNDVVQNMLDDAKSKDSVVSTNTLERAMLIINDTPGVIVTGADVMPGSEVGTSDFAVTTQATKRVDGYVLVDNYGSKYTGHNRMMLGLNINSPFEIGDKIALSGLTSNSTDLKNGRVAYEAPLSPSGLKGEISYSQTNYSLSKLDGTPDDAFKGNSKTVETKLSYPIIRTRAENLYSNLIFGKKDLNDEYLGDKTNPRDIKYARMGVDYTNNYLAFNKNSQSAMLLNLTLGNVSFDNDTDRSDDINGANTNGTYSKINVELSHNISLLNNLSLDSSLQMQHSFGNKNLDGSEDLSIGGISGTKLYPSGELSAENGYIFTTELKYQFITNAIGIFYDRGRAWMANSNNVDFESKSLQDAGIGLYTSYDKFFSKIQVAWDVNSANVTAEEANNQSKVLFQAGMTF